MPVNLRSGSQWLGARRGGLGATAGPATPGTPPSGSPLLTDLISYWKLDEASGNATDAHGTNHLTDTNTVTSVAGKQGTARQFTAANTEYFAIASNASLQTGNIDFTIACWAYFDDLSGQRALAGRWFTSNNHEYILLFVPGTGLQFYVDSTGVGADGVVTGGTFPTTATWYFVVAWHDSVANTLNLQINNGTVASAAHTLGVFAGGADFQMGRNQESGSPMDGRIDEMGVWKRVLTAGERTQLYASGAGVTYPTFA